MIRYITIRRTCAALMAGGLLAQCTVPKHGAVPAKPIAAWEAQQIKGSALGVVSIPWSIYIAALTVDAAFITSMVNLFIESSKATEDKNPVGAL